MAINDSHYTIGGKKFIRVTALLERVGHSDFSDIPTNDRAFYLERGTARHEFFEHVESGVDHLHTYDHRIEAYRAGHARFLHETGFKALHFGIEKRVSATWESLGFFQRNYLPFREAGVAGRLDRFGTCGSRLVLWDYKGHDVPKSTAAQTALYLLLFPKYKFADVERYGVSILLDGTYKMSPRYPKSDLADVEAMIHQYLKEPR